MVVPPKKYVEDIPRVQGEVHANFGPDPSSSLGGELETNKQTDRQTDRQTDLSVLYLCIDIWGVSGREVIFEPKIL